MSNESVGLVTAEAKKEKQELEKKLSNKRIDFDFYSQGMPFIGVQPHSANHLFGNASWKKAIREKLGEEKLKQFSEKYGNKPIDFKLAGFHIEPKNAAYFNKQESISIKVTTGDQKYNGTYPIIEKGKDYVLVMKEYLGDASGSVINESRAKGAERKIKELNSLLSNLISSGPITPGPNPTDPTPPPPPPLGGPYALPLEETKKPEGMSTLKKVGIVVGLLGLAYAGYKLYEWQNKKAA